MGAWGPRKCVAAGAICRRGRGTHHAGGVSGERAGLPLTSSRKLLAAKNSKSAPSKKTQVQTDFAKISLPPPLVRVLEAPCADGCVAGRRGS